MNTCGMVFAARPLDSASTRARPCRAGRRSPRTPRFSSRAARPRGCNRGTRAGCRSRSFGIALSVCDHIEIGPERRAAQGYIHPRSRHTHAAVSRSTRATPPAISSARAQASAVAPLVSTSSISSTRAVHQPHPPRRPHGEGARRPQSCAPPPVLCRQHAERHRGPHPAQPVDQRRPAAQPRASAWASSADWL